MTSSLRGGRRRPDGEKHIVFTDASSTFKSRHRRRHHLMRRPGVTSDASDSGIDQGIETPSDSIYVRSLWNFHKNYYWEQGGIVGQFS